MAGTIAVPAISPFLNPPIEYSNSVLGLRPISLQKCSFPFPFFMRITHSASLVFRLSFCLFICFIYITIPRYRIAIKGATSFSSPRKKGLTRDWTLGTGTVGERADSIRYIELPRRDRAERNSPFGS